MIVSFAIQRAALALALGLVWASPSAERSRAEGPPGPEPIGALSDAGSDRGGLELGLGTATLATSVALIAYGSVEIVRGLNIDRVCSGREPVLQTAQVECVFEPPFVESPNFHYASAGLSYGFALPLLVGTGFLLAKGVRIHRDWKAFHANKGAAAWDLQPTVSRRHFGLGLRLTF